MPVAVEIFGMRPPLGSWRLCVVLCVILAASLPAQTPDETRPYNICDLSFQVPANWRVQAAPAGAPSGVVFSAYDGQNGRLTVARLPATPAAKPLDSSLNPLTAPETADYRIALQEAGLTPVSGAIRTAIEGNTSVETVSFRCRAETGSTMLVLITTWRSEEIVVRARLQVADDSSPATVSALASIRRSLQYRGAATLGFGDFTGRAPETQAGMSTASPDLAISPAASIAQMVQDYRGSLVFIESGNSSGSGFVCQMADGVYLLTNQHVLAGMNVPRFTRLDRAPITTGAGAAAVGHDLMRFVTQGETRPLVAMNNVESEAKIGDDIVVVGNMEGARVIQPLPGKLIGIGPDRVEVTAEFVPGNSGSPIIHVKSGKVIGIATYLLQRQFTDLTESNQAKVRRFGFRLDSVKQWQGLNWQAFQQDKQMIDRVESTTRDLIQLIRDLQGSQAPTAAAYRNATVSRAVRDLENMLSRQRLSAPDRARAFQSFVASIRATTQADIVQARQSVRYDYFAQSLRDEAAVREEMYKLFDRLLKSR